MAPALTPRRSVKRGGIIAMSRAWLEPRLTAAWQRDSRWLLPLRPLAALYGALLHCRRTAATLQTDAPPLIVVGNITVGGSGKTPLLIAIAEQLRQSGWRPGIVSRGYGGRCSHYPLQVTAQTPAAECGDEPRLIANRTGLPVVVDPDRSRAVRHLQRCADVDVVLSDDGLQHHAMARSVEIVVVDGERQFANQRLLPAGPLREPLRRLESVDLVVVNGSQRCPQAPHSHAMALQAQPLLALNAAARSAALTAGSRVHAVAAIGHPQRFAKTLHQLGFAVQLQSAPDHATLTAAELTFSDGEAVVVTEKDAVKLSPALCAEVANPLWALPITAQLPALFWSRLDQLLGAAPSHQ